MHIKSLLVPAAIVCGSLTVALGDGPAPAPNPPNLNAPRNSRVNDFVFTCALGDIDGDGRLDAVAAGEMLHSVRGIGGGWFSDPTQIGFGALHALGDVDRDGDLDLLIYRFGIVEVRLNDGTGNFGDTTTYATGAHPQGDPVDMDGDGILDLVQLGNGSVSIAYGDGNGGFASAEQVVSVGFEPFSAAVADFDGDGRLDVVVGGAADGGAATIIPSAGSRTFGTPVVVGKHVNASGEVKAGDCDGDGHADVITWSQADGVIVFRGKGNLNFKHEKKTPAGDIVSIAVGDFNGDGRTDVATAEAIIIQVLLSDDQGEFTSITPYLSGSGTARLRVADVDGDGKLDLVTANNGTVSLVTLLNQGGGTFSSVHRSATFGVLPRTLATGDLDGDGRPEVLMGAGFGFTVYNAMADGGLSPPMLHPADVPNRDSSALALADMNGDGKLDLVVASQTRSEVQVLHGDGAGGLSAAAVASVGSFTSPRGLAIADLNGDGRRDILTANGATNDVSVLLSNGAGGFLPATRYPTGGSGACSVTVADLDADGALDVIVGHDLDTRIAIFPGLGSGALGTAILVTVGVTPVLAKVADLDADGKPDLVVACQQQSTATVLRNLGGLAFAAPVDFSAGAAPADLVLIDLNGDGKLDIATANETGYDCTVLMADGAGGFGRPWGFLCEEGSVSIVAAVLTASGKPDLIVANKYPATLNVLTNH